MIHIEQISPIATILLDAAKARRTATYTAIYHVFGKEVPDEDVFDTVEAAGRALSYSTFAIYSAVLAKKELACRVVDFLTSIAILDRLNIRTLQETQFCNTSRKSSNRK